MVWSWPILRDALKNDCRAASDCKSYRAETQARPSKCQGVPIQDLAPDVGKLTDPGLQVGAPRSEQRGQNDGSEQITRNEAAARGRGWGIPWGKKCCFRPNGARPGRCLADTPQIISGTENGASQQISQGASGIEVVLQFWVYDHNN